MPATWKKWTPEELAFVRAHYVEYGPTITAALLRQQLGCVRAVKAVALKARSLGLLAVANRGQFAKGHKPHNHGRPISPEWAAKTAATRFRKGHQPANTARHDGVIRCRRHKSGPAYLYIRVALGRWVLLHRYRWEQARGPIPPGMIVVFRDGNPKNCELENLHLITRAELVRRNSNRTKAARSMRRYHQRRRLEESGLSFVDAVLQCRI